METTSPLIEYTQGSESHSSSWGKFYVKGLEKWAVKEDGEYDKHSHYTEYAADVPPGIIFTVFSQKGDKRGTESFDFYICEAKRYGEVIYNRIGGGHPRSTCQVTGPYVILCRGRGTTKAPRLMGWWEALSQKCAAFRCEDGKLAAGTKKRFAFWCAKHLEKRGLKDLPEMPAGYSPPIMQSETVTN